MDTVLRSSAFGLSACPNTLPANPPPCFPSVPTKARFSESRAFFFVESLTDSASLAHCCTVRQLHCTITLLIFNFLSAVVTMSLNQGLEGGTCPPSVQLNHDHVAICSPREVEYIAEPAGSASLLQAPDRFGGLADDASRQNDPSQVLVTRPFPSLASIPVRTAPENFGIVVPGKIYRSGYPEEAHFDFVKALDLRTIITLVDYPVPGEYRELMSSNSIRHIVAPVTPNKNKNDKRKRTEAKQIANVLDHMMSAANYPMLVHCNAGKHRSGCVTAVFRKCSGVPMDQIIDEYVRYAGVKSRILDICFIKAFDEYEYLWSTTIKEGTLLTGSSEHVIDPIRSPLSPALRAKV